MITADDGYFFGLGAFETIAVDNGIPQFLRAHMDRLERAVAFLEASVVFQANVRERHTWHKAIHDQIAEYPQGRYAVKIAVSPHNVVTQVRPNTYDEATYRRGYVCSISSIRRNESSPLVAHKLLNCAENMVEKRAAHRQGADEVLFLNSRGELAEGAVTNVFLVRDGVIMTPPSSAGILPGIMRAWVCEQVPVIRRPITAADIAYSEEMFLTNSLMNVMPVRMCGEHAFTSMRTGWTLHERYRSEHCATTANTTNGN